MILVRGLPGSGKSTKAREIMDYRTHAVAWCEADHYFITNGKYSYDQSRVSIAHRWCQKKAEDGMLQGHDIIVSNTFTTYAEMIPYFILAKDYGYRVEIIKCIGEFPNIHGVPDDVIQRMKDRWED
jgi:predicted kinase